MALVRADLEMDVVLSDDTEGKLTIRDINPTARENYLAQMAVIMKDTFSVKGKNIKTIKAMGMVKTDYQTLSIVPV